MSGSDFLETPWKAQVNDLIGGWCVTPADDGRRLSEGAPSIADFTDEAVARHIAELHNEHLIAAKDLSQVESG